MATANPAACGGKNQNASRHSVDSNRAPPNTSRFPNRSAKPLEKPMPTIMKMMPQALNRLKAEVGASSGHWNPARPTPVSSEFRPAMKALKPTPPRNSASAASSM